MKALVSSVLMGLWEWCDQRFCVNADNCYNLSFKRAMFLRRKCHGKRIFDNGFEEIVENIV